MSRRLLVTGGSGFIGTNLVAHYIARGEPVVNLDVAPPRDPTHAACWRSCDVGDRGELVAAVAAADPTHVVHLAARTDLTGGGADDYAVNTEGTQNLLAAVEGHGGVERLVVASSLLVCRNGYTPASDTDYCPTTAYGRSKQQMEELVRRWAPACPWVIVRPTSIWGPWFATPYRDFFDHVLAGRYVHPGRTRVDKAFGFVGNTVVQIDALLDGGEASSTHYLADTPPYSIDELADAIAAAAGRRAPRRVPLAALRVAATVGDVAARLGVWSEPPLTRFRLENMLTSSAFPSAELDELTGPLPFSMPEGVGRTLGWLAESDRR